MIGLIAGSSLYSMLAIAIAGLLALGMAITFHEASHAFVAYKCGDTTPKAYGRLTLNPFKHFDPWGTVMLFILGFGWAKPVPVNSANFKHYRRDSFFVSMAGILCNLILAFLFSSIYVLVEKYAHSGKFYCLLLYYFAYMFVVYNINLAVFNLIPIFPLDGFNALVSISKNQNNRFLNFMRQNGSIVLIIVILLFSWVLIYPTQFLLDAFANFWKLII